MANTPVDGIVNEVGHWRPKKGSRSLFDEESWIDDPLFTIWSADSDLEVGMIVVTVDFAQYFAGVELKRRARALCRR
ncbi:MAG: hypothetical protein HOP13_19060 [Alphaproteobacteria bacterium]|nr:hypothetical protein [Alphaproteobacteria bacterium]